MKTGLPALALLLLACTGEGPGVPSSTPGASSSAPAATSGSPTTERGTSAAGRGIRGGGDVPTLTEPGTGGGSDSPSGGPRAAAVAEDAGRAAARPSRPVPAGRRGLERSGGRDGDSAVTGAGRCTAPRLDPDVTVRELSPDAPLEERLFGRTPARSTVDDGPPCAP